jgi:hypothetical protein
LEREMAFRVIQHPGVSLWEGDPDCQTAHDALLTRLAAMHTSFIGVTATLDVKRKGNIGEFISLYVSSYTGLRPAYCFANNAVNPLSGISLSGLDITYILLDQANPVNDLAILQEVKTTGDTSLNHANHLIRDYQKLFDGDLDFTLASRLQVIANKFEMEQHLPHLCERVLALAGDTPNECSHVNLFPTLVHEKNGAAPLPKLLAIRTSISSQGWPLTRISAWSIALSDLDKRLERLARGHK